MRALFDDGWMRTVLELSSFHKIKRLFGFCNAQSFA
jgi:hypothetical protein